MSYLSSTTGDHHHHHSLGGSGGGGLDFGGGTMLGGGNGMGTDDMLQTAATTDINMFPNYMSSASTNHVTNAHQLHNHQYGTSAPNLHNGLSHMDMDEIMMTNPHNPHHSLLNELPPMRHQENHLLDHQQQHHMHQHHQLSSSLGTSYYFNNNDHHRLLTANNTHNNSPHHQRYRHKSENFAQSTSSPASLLNAGSSSGVGITSYDDHWLPSGGVGEGSSTTGGVMSDYLSGHHHHQQQQQHRRRDNFGLVNDYSNYSSTTAPPSPPPHRSGSSTQQQYALQQQQYRTQPSQHSYSAAATNPAASLNYESNLRYNSDHYSPAINLNAHYSSGGGGPSGGLDPTSGVLGGGPPGSGTGLFGVGRPGVPGGGVGGMGMMGGGGEEEVRPSASSESQAYYGNETMVKELRPEFVRWFYRYETDRKWRSFTGYDSIRIESKYRDVYRDQIGSYSHSAYYPLASSNDESTDFSRFAHQQHMNNNGMGMGGGNGNPNQPGGGRFSDMMQQKWWPGKGPETTVDTEFNNGGPGFPSQVRNHSMGNSLFGRMGNGTMGPGAGIRPDRALYKANSTSALLGSGPNGLNSPYPHGHHTDINNIVVVREGLYEVDLGSWTCFSTYWPGDTCLITRGTWFYDGTWDPLPVEQAEKLEEAHMLKFCGAALLNNQQQAPGHSYPDDPQNKTGNSANAPAVHRITFNEFHVDWKSPTDIFWYSQATSHKLMRSFGQKLGLSDWSHRICRGYYKPAMIQDRPSEISHIVFVIHGIGQKMDTGRIVRNCSAFRDCVQSMKDKYFPQLNNAKQRAEFFPVEWRSSAKLDNDVVDAITPQKLLSLRQMLNSTAMDIMYYTSPLYRAEIQNALIEELNRIYGNFVKRNPNFAMNGGKVSVMAHSLGAVITYDILTGYLCGSVEDEIALMQQQQLHIPRRVIPHQQGLMFTLEHFFCLGSPLSVFLALRWREPHDPALRSQILPQHLCRRIYNVFYSSDPVAYRLEPLLSRHYAKIAPVTIHTYNAPVKPRYCDMPREKITIVSSKTASDNTNTATATSTLPVPFADNSTIPTVTQKTPTNKPTLPSMPAMPSLLPSPSKEANNWGGWFGNNIKKMLKSAPNPVSGVSLPNPVSGMSLSNPAGGLSIPNPMSGGMSFSNPMGGLSLPNPMSGMSGLAGALDPTGLTGGSSNHPTHEGDLNNPGGIGHPSMEEANFLAQSNKENYSTVVDEELMNIPNDLDYRLDFVLRESQFSGSSYIAALTSHTSYWSSPDAAYFVMTHLYDELIEQTNSYSGER